MIWFVLVVGVLVGVARATAIRWWRVPEDDPYLEASIAPTLRPGDLDLALAWKPCAPR
ncbi:MAG: hypothetical protein QM756_37890 [Polyangiaceae bacterium]